MGQHRDAAVTLECVPTVGPPVYRTGLVGSIPSKAQARKGGHLGVRLIPASRIMLPQPFDMHGQYGTVVAQHTRTRAQRKVSQRSHPL